MWDCNAAINAPEGLQSAGAWVSTSAALPVGRCDNDNISHTQDVRLLIAPGGNPPDDNDDGQSHHS